MTPTVSFEVTSNLQDLRRVATEWRRGLETELLPLLAGRVRDQTRARISTTKTSPDGRKWIARKKTKKRHGLMTRTRRLLRSVRAQRLQRDLFAVGTPLEYARAHQEGTDKMPRREIFGLGPRDLEDVEDVIDAWTMRFGSRTRSLARSLRK